MSNQFESRTVGSSHCGKHRMGVLTVGDRCRVEPISPSKKKNRGRVCTIVGFRKFGASIEMASVIWEDTQEYGGADMSDLVVIPLCEIEAR